MVEVGTLVIDQLCQSRFVRRGQLNGGIGHNLPQEAPRAFADAVIEADRL
jgi:hypothetical protein